jgi:hypothetical protein
MLFSTANIGFGRVGVGIGVGFGGLSSFVGVARGVGFTVGVSSDSGVAIGVEPTVALGDGGGHG